jgi:HEAT repeat protein/cyclophilin family peptidyl-prolyl cis-trans isomerase
VRLLLTIALLPTLAFPQSRATKLGRLLALEEERSAGSGEIARLLADPDTGVRRRAALAAGRIGDATLVPPLSACLDDREVEVRQMAAFALGLIGDRSAQARLVAALSDHEPVVRARAAEALGRLGDKGVVPDVTRMVLAALPRGARQITVRGDDPTSPTDPWLELRLGLLALAALGDAPAAEKVLLLDGQPRFDWWAAAYAAAALRSPALRPAYLGAMRSRDPLCRAFGARGLGYLSEPASIDALASLTADPDERVVREALRALAPIADVRRFAPALSALASQSPAVKQDALAVLAAPTLDRGLRDQLIAHVGSPDPGVRAAAIAALARVDAEQLALVLSGADPDPEWSVRAAVARSAAEIGGELGIGLAFGALQDQDARVIPAALQALRRLRGVDATETLRKYLGHSDPAVRTTATQELAALHPAGLAPALAGAYAQALGDDEACVRGTLISVAAREPGDAAVELLRRAAAQDPLPEVRRLAAGCLRERNLTPPAAARGRERAFVDYRTAMAPFAPLSQLPLFTPRMFVKTSRGQIEVHLNVVDAPLAASAFTVLARRGFFNGQSFSETSDGLSLEGGCPRGDGFGGPGFVVPREIGLGAFGRGAVALLPAQGLPDAVGSRFLITLVPTPALDGRATLLGWVVSGWEVLQRLRPGDAVEAIEVWNGR